MNYDEYVDMEDYIETEVKILQSETLALQTMNGLYLVNIPNSAEYRVHSPYRIVAWTRSAPYTRCLLGTSERQREPNSHLIDES